MKLGKNVSIITGLQLSVSLPTKVYLCEILIISSTILSISIITHTYQVLNRDAVMLNYFVVKVPSNVLRFSNSVPCLSNSFFQLLMLFLVRPNF